MEPLGTYIYMGMGLCKTELVCMSVAYKLDYCVKKALQFEKISEGTVELESVNKVKVGELTKCDSYSRRVLFKDFHHIFKEHGRIN